MRLEFAITLVLVAAALPSRRAFAQDQVEPGVEFERAAQLMASGDRDRAYPHLVRLTEGGAPFPEAYLFRGSIERERGELSRAEAAFLGGLEIAPTHRSLRMELAVTLSWEGRTDEALEAYDEVLAADPHDAAAAIGRARMLFWLGRHEESVTAFEELLRQEPDNVEALAGLADVHRARLRRRDARTLYDRALVLDPAFAAAREGKSKLREATRAIAGLDLGFATSDAGVSGRGGLSLAVDVRPELRLDASFRQDAQRNELATARTGTLALVVRPSARFSIDAGYQIQHAEGLRTHRVTLGGAVRVSDEWTLILSTRPGVREDGRMEHLTMVGTDHRAGVFHWTVQLFRSDHRDRRETVASLAGELDFGVFAVRIGLAGALAPENYATMGGLLRVTLSGHHDLVAGYDHFTLGRRHLFSVGYRVRL